MLLLAASPKEQFVFAYTANNNANAIHLLQGGPAITVGYSISPNSGCHVGDGIGGNPAPVYITIGNPAPSYITITSAKFVTGTVNGHTIPPNTLKFTSCNVNQDVVYSAPSTATIGKIVGTVTAFQSSQISNTNPGNLNIFVENGDNTAPTITVPAAMIVQATSQSGAAVTYAVTATDPNKLLQHSVALLHLVQHSHLELQLLTAARQTHMETQALLHSQSQLSIRQSQ